MDRLAEECAALGVERKEGKMGWLTCSVKLTLTISLRARDLRVSDDRRKRSLKYLCHSPHDVWSICGFKKKNRKVSLLPCTALEQLLNAVRSIVDVRASCDDMIALRERVTIEWSYSRYV